MSPFNAPLGKAAQMEHLLMSLKERNRMGVLKQVKAKLLSIVAAGKLLRLSYRQAKRVWCRYRDKGDKGLVHRGRGRVGKCGKAADIRDDLSGAGPQIVGFIFRRVNDL